MPCTAEPPKALRNTSRSPDCAIETRVLVMDVPTLTPMMMGTDARTVSSLEATMLTTMEEDVLELCTRTVTSTPRTSPATGLDSTTLSLKASPATLLPSSWKAELRMSREQMKR